MPFLTRPHFEDRQIVQYSNESISLSGTSYIAATVLDFSGTTTGETAVTINSLTGYLNGQRLSGLVIEPAQLKLSGTTGTTTQNVTGFVLQSIDPYGAVEWAPLSGVSWSVSACTSPLYVSTIEACPNPTDPIYITAGNVQFGASPSLIADITNTRLGIGTGSPSESLHIENGDILIQNSSSERFYSDMGGAAGPRVLISADTNSLASFNVTGNAIGGNGGLSMGIRGLTASFPGYGKQGDSFVYSSVYNNGLNIISSPTTGPQITDDYIRFYAGQDASGTIPDLHIQGSGVTRGNVGINTITPTEKLHIQDGDLLIAHNQNENTKININNFGGSNDSKSTINFQISGSSLITSVAGTISAIGPDSIPTGTFMGNYLPNSLNITTAGGSLSNRMHINIGSRRGSDAQTRFFGGDDDFNSSSLLGIFYTSGLTITDMVNTDTLRVRDGATLGHVLTSDANGNATWQYNSTGFSGNTSASCITDLYVSNIYGCSPITIHDSVQHTGSTASGTKSVAFGLDNVTNSDNSAILSGNDNNIDSSDNSTIGGGKFNTITGGTDNFIAAGGFASVANSNQILGTSRSFIGGGRANKILISDSSIAGGSSNELNGGTGNFIGAGGGNTIDGSSAKQSSIGGGSNNTIDSSKHSFIGGGLINTIDTSVNSFIGGGNTNNLIDSSTSIIVGGQDNSLSGSTYSFIGGGLSNVLNSGSTHSFIGGGSGNEISSGSLYSLIIGGLTNRLSNSSYSLISGGLDNIISGNLLSGNSVVGGQNNTINSNFMSDGIYNSIIAGGRNNLINGIDSYIFMGGGLSNTVKTSGDGHSGATIVGGGYNIIDMGFDSGIFGGTYGYVYNSQQSSLIGGAHNSLNNVYNSVVLGGQNITGTTLNTVYTPNLTVRGDFILHSDTTLEVSELPSSYEDIIKGSYTNFNWYGVTTHSLSNNNPSGYTSVVLGNLDNYPTDNTFGFVSYFNSGHTRASFSGPVGDDFYRNKLVVKGSSGSDGMVINPHGGNASASLWFEMDGRSVMKLKGDGSTKARLGIAMSEDGTEDATANLQIGGTGTTGTFKYIDGNEQSGYVLTSDVDGNATWQVSSASGGTSGGITIDPYEDIGNVNSITWDVSGTSTNYEATLTGNTTLDLTNVRNGDYGTIIMEQDGVGSHTLTLGTVNGGGGTHKVVNGGGGTIVLTGTANSIDLLTFTYNGNIVWWSIGPNYT